jgi:hypothetical protein
LLARRSGGVNRREAGEDAVAMADKDAAYTLIVGNKKFEVHVLDPKEARRDNIRLTLYSDDGENVHHHLRSYEVMRLIEALNQAIAFGPPIPKS